MRKKIFAAFLLPIALSSLALSGCSNSSTSSDPITKTDFGLDTVITIKIYDSEDTDLLDGCFDVIDKYENLLSTTIETSEIYEINHANGEPVEVSDETAELLQEGLDYCKLSDGNFDITIGSVTNLWDFTSDDPVVPDDSDIQEALESVGYENVSLDENTVQLSNPETQLDLGGIAKGFIADKVKDYLESEGVEHAVLQLGGNVLTIGNNTTGNDFNIGIQKPFSDQNVTIGYATVNDKSVVSSGNYERYFEQDGILYYHILNPKTGYPFDTDLYDVTIISDDSVDGDGLSTTCFSLGVDDGLDLINSIDDVEAIFITSDYEIYYSDGAKDIITITE